jgi:PilZ domain
VTNEKRKSARQRMFLRGFIRVPQNTSNFDCIVRNLSETGAKLRFRCRPPVTDFLELHIPTKRKIAQSKVMWIDDCEVGVSFEDIVNTFPSASDSELSDRIARLEGEITALKQIVYCLRSRLTKTKPLTPIGIVPRRPN